MLDISNDFHSRLSKDQSEEYFDNFRKQQPCMSSFISSCIDFVKKDKNAWEKFIKLTTITVHGYKYYNLNLAEIKEDSASMMIKKWAAKLKANNPQMAIALFHKHKHELMQPHLFKMYDEWIFGTPEEPSLIKQKDQIYMYFTLINIVDLFNQEVLKLLPPDEK